MAYNLKSIYVFYSYIVNVIFAVVYRPNGVYSIIVFENGRVTGGGDVRTPNQKLTFNLLDHFFPYD